MRALSTRPWLLIVPAALAFACVLALRGAQYWVFTLDDAYITLRYSAHLAQGLGPSWNPGGPAAEGYTTTLWMAVLALAIRLGLDGLLFAKLAGAVFALGALAIASRLASSLTEGALPRAIAGSTPWLMAIAYWPLSLHAVSGMETTCSAFVLTWFFWLSCRAQQTQRYRGLALSALAAGLARPEAVLACLVSLVALAMSGAGSPLAPAHASLARGSARFDRRSFVRALVLYAALPGALYFAWRYVHFGLLFPLSFYVKATGRASLAGLSDVLEFATMFVRRPWWGALAVFGAWRMPVLRPALWGALAFAVFFVFPEHIMAFESRYLVPLFPLLAALAGVGAGKLAVWLGARVSQRVLLAPLAIMFSLAAVPMSVEASAERWLDYGRGLTRAHVALAHAMRDARVQDGRIALLDVGAIGYYADWYTLDTFGLNDAHVALTQRTDVDYVFAAEPDLLVLVSATPHTFEALFPWEAPLHQEASRRGFQYLCEYRFDSNYYLHVFARTPDATRDPTVCRAATPAMP